MSSQVALVVKNLPANAGDVREVGSIPGSGRTSGGGDGNPLQYSCLENPMDRGSWQAMVHWVIKSQTWLKWLSMHSCKQETIEECEHIGFISRTSQIVKCYQFYICIIKWFKYKINSFYWWLKFSFNKWNQSKTLGNSLCQRWIT